MEGGFGTMPNRTVLSAAALILVALAVPTMAQLQRPTSGKSASRPPARGPIRVANQPSRAAEQPPASRAQFTLTPQQQSFLDQLLVMWEQKSSQVKTFKCKFTLWTYNPSYGPIEEGGGRGAQFISQGEIKYKAPDHGAYKVIDLHQWSDKTKQYEKVKEGLDHWVCNGKSIFEFAHVKKQLIERQIPRELQGTAITNGPIPFIFGAKAEKLKKRYFLRDVTPTDWVKKGVWLEAFPRYQHDAANFQRATLILTEPDFLPYALQIYLPDGKNWQAYRFDEAKVNGWLDSLLEFRAPSTPIGWKRVVEAAPREGPDGQIPASRQAQKSRGETLKK